MSVPSDPLMLAHWRRAVAELYAQVRESAERDAAAAAAHFRERRERLFREHPQSPIDPAKRSAWRTRWHPYDPHWRLVGRFSPAAGHAAFEIPLVDDGITRCARVGTVDFEMAGRAARLALYWFAGYGGGLWLPFTDASSGADSYAGGRYLYDTIKGADLGATAERFVLDFNFAYNPSCAYDDRWSCPLSPPENRLPFAVSAGERVPVED